MNEELKGIIDLLAVIHDENMKIIESMITCGGHEIAKAYDERFNNALKIYFNKEK